MEDYNSNVYEALNIILTTDDSKYLDIDSHYVHIPMSLFSDFVLKNQLRSSCVEISEFGVVGGKRIYLSKIEPSYDDFEKQVLLPNWVCEKLKVGMDGGLVGLKLIQNPPRVKRIKIQGDNSTYVKLDIKTLLEQKIEQLRCINLSSQFHIEGVIFSVIELVSNHNEPIEYGIVTNELEIDFETPCDIQFLEKRKNMVERVIDKIESKYKESDNKITQIKKTQFKGIVGFGDLKKNLENLEALDKSVDLDLVYNEMIEDLTREFESITRKDELEFNKKLLKDIIDDGKQRQKDLAEKLRQSGSNVENVQGKINSESITNTNVFNTQGHKLLDSQESSKQLTREEIKKMRLLKFSQNQQG